jgi:hypothetical protein
MVLKFNLTTTHNVIAACPQSFFEKDSEQVGITDKDDSELIPDIAGTRVGMTGPIPDKTETRAGMTD